MSPRLVLAVALGGALGALVRFGISLAVLEGPAGLPWSTLLANVLGSFAIGWIAASAGPRGRIILSPALYQFLVTGFCGGLTTFSLFSLELFTLIDRGAFGFAAAYLALSLILWLVSVWAGYALGRRKTG